MWNARVLLRELRERNCTGGYTILTDLGETAVARQALRYCDRMVWADFLFPLRVIHSIALLRLAK